jgi:hypothetical protein
MVGAVHVANNVRGTAASTCAFRAVTGVPCPTCGATRAAFALVSGDPAGALRRNPLVAGLLIGVPVWGATRLGAGRRLRVECGSRERTVLWAVASLLVIANWVYVLAAETG